jgi:glycerol-3-phosphate acyltransferase PlsY
MDLSILFGLLFLALGSYLYGSICWAIVIGRIKNKEDIRTMGDRNPGAYNTGRSLGAKFGVLCMLLDATKGLIPAILSSTINFGAYQNWAIGLAGSFAVFGHCYPIFFRFKGGNGYSTIFGFMIIFNPCMIIEWGVLVFVLTLIFKYIRPMQFIAIIITGITSLFIPWSFYWRNLGFHLTKELAMAVLPLLVFTVIIIQIPKFIPFFYGIFKGTEEKMYFFRPSKKKEEIIESSIVE